MKVALFAASAVSFLLTVSGGSAFAFDCNKASTKIERAICTDPTLKATDDAMSAAYSELKHSLQGNEASMLQLAQKRWLSMRDDRCAAESGQELTTCLLDFTKERRLLLEGAPESGPGAGARIIPVFIQQEGGPKKYDVDYTLLRFADADTPGQKLFNRELDAIAKKAPLGRQNADVMEGMELSAIASAALSYASPKVISSAITLWSFDGGAHGNGGLTNVNVDLVGGRNITFDTLFDPADKEPLVVSCRQQIKDQKTEKMDGEEFKPADDPNYQDSTIEEHVGDLSRWSFTSENAVVTFDAYAIGSYAEGSYTCTYAMGLLRSLARDPALLPEE
ncbi:MAG: lysozyme inhibitor LprI family protein [Hyphomicrobiales bacterium]